MKIVFFVPPATQRVGGLDAAIDGLRGALERRGIAVLDKFPAGASDDCVAHFHGLWQRDHTRLASECRARGIPYAVSPHGMLEPWAWRHKWWKKWPYFYLVEKRHLTRARAILATAEPEARRLRALLPGQRISALPLGMTGDAQPDYENARARLGWLREERVLVFLSRIHVKKGLDLLLRALATMPHPAATRLVIVGEGAAPYVARLRRFATDHASVLPRIDWPGAVWGAEKWKYLQGADLFCLPSHSENFGLAVLEACQVGTPALTTDATPWAEELRDGRGFICAAQIDEVRQTLARFFARERWTPEERAGLAEWTGARFHWDALAERYVEFYRSLKRA